MIVACSVLSGSLAAPVLPLGDVLSNEELAETEGGLLFTSIFLIGAVPLFAVGLGGALILDFALIFDFDLVDIDLIGDFGVWGPIDVVDPIEIFDPIDLIGL